MPQGMTRPARRGAPHLPGVFMSPNHFAAGKKFFTEKNPG